MAETFDDDSTDRFSLLRTWYLYILDELTHSKDQTEIIVQRFFQDGEYDLFNPKRKRYRLWSIDVVPGGVAPSPYKGEFWQSDPARGIECKIDGLNSSARWTGPASAEWRARGRQSSEYQINLIWVNDAAMVDFLRGVGFPLTQFDAAQPELPLTEPIHNSPPMSGDADTPPTPASTQAASSESSPKTILSTASESEPESEPEWGWDPNDSVEVILANLELEGSRVPMRTLIEACRKLPKHARHKGKGIAEILDNMTPTKLHKAVNKCASWETCGKLLAAWERRRARSSR
jgi:hypothetical protein